MNNPQQQCPELTEQTANSIDNDILSHLFVSVQMNNLHLCIQDAMMSVPYQLSQSYIEVCLIVLP